MDDRVWFEQWQTPDAFRERVDAINPSRQFRKNEFKFWREAWVAGRFGLLAYPNEYLRLTPESSPIGDFELRSAGSNAVFEIAEALNAGIQPALKVLHQRPEGERHLTICEEELSGDMARELILTLISKKAAKRYPSGTGLVIYLNVWDDELPLSELPGLASKVEHGFASIWVVNSTSVCRVFPKLLEFGEYHPQEITDPTFVPESLESILARVPRGSL